MGNKSIVRYLAIVFILGYGLQLGSLASGILNTYTPSFFQWILLVVIMFVPIVAAVAAALSGGRESIEAGHAVKFWPVPVRPAVFWALVPVILFAITYGISAFFNFQVADFTMHEAIAEIRAMSPQPLPENSTNVVGYLMLSIGLPVSVILGATLFALVAIGQEYGWRGFLFAQAAQQGKIRAHIYLAVITFVWALPMFYWGLGTYLEGAELGYALLRVFLLMLMLNIILGEIFLQHRNVGLCAILLGGFLCQHYSGVWTYLFPMDYYPYTGTLGLINVAVWGVFAVGFLFFVSRKTR